MMQHPQLKIHKLEEELQQKQIQFKALLTITQAINENVSAEGLFEMYKSFLSWDMDIHHMALFFKNNDTDWECVTSINYTPENVNETINSIKPYKRKHAIEEDDASSLQQFDVVIPVFHKDHAIAYALIGGGNIQEDVFDKTQFITTITNMIAVAIENKKLFRRQLEQEQYKKELEFATSVQQMLIPQRLPRKDDIYVSKIYKPHSDVGGDYLDVVRLTAHKYALCIGDISGKGVAAAILMANFQAQIQSSIRQYKKLEDFIVDLNDSVYNITKSDKFITFFVCVVDTETRKISYINCGHHPPILLADGQCKDLKEGTTFLGAFEALPDIQKGIVEYEDEAFLLLFTDGLSDLLDKDGEYFDSKHIKTFVEKHHDINPTDFNNLLLDRIASFKGEQQYTDDIAILTCKLN